MLFLKNKLQQAGNHINWHYLLYLSIYSKFHFSKTQAKRFTTIPRINNENEAKTENWKRTTSAVPHSHYVKVIALNICIYALGRCFYTKYLQLHSVHLLGIKLMTLALLVPCPSVWSTGTLLYCVFQECLLAKHTVQLVWVCVWSDRGNDCKHKQIS